MPKIIVDISSNGTAKNTGVSLKMLVKGVYHLEVQIEKWSRADRKNRPETDEDHMSSGSDDD